MKAVFIKHTQNRIYTSSKSVYKQFSPEKSINASWRLVMANISIESKILLGDKVILTLLSSYFILKPFYLWESGLPQISDLVLVTAIALYIIKNKMKVYIFKQSIVYILLNFIFAFYISFINTLWSLILNGELSFIEVPMFYIFNFIVAVIIVSLHKQYGERIYMLIYSSVLASIIFQFIIFSLSGGFAGNRVMAYFNNPNQLGYHCVLTLALLLFISEKLDVNAIWLMVGIFFTTVLCFASLSKAAIISLLGMLFYSILLHIKNWIFAKKIKKTYLAFVLIIIAMSIAYQYNNEVFSSNFLFASVKYRLSTIGQSSDDNLSQRGYDRLIANPQYLLFGAGEGAYSRFGLTSEFHSTIGNLLMSFGLIGISIYLAILFIACKKNRWKGLYIIGFITLYGLTHNGIRNTLFWVMISLIYSNSFESRNIKTYRRLIQRV
jgi:hypothetical protein